MRTQWKPRYFTSRLLQWVFLSLKFSFFLLSTLCLTSLVSWDCLPFCISKQLVSSTPLFLSAPCSTVTCELYAECVSSNDTTGVCVCPNDCPSKLSPVCGSDGNTYNSACHLRVDSCKRKANVTVRHVGKCSKFWGFYLFPSSLLYLEFLVSGERLFFSHLSKLFFITEAFTTQHKNGSVAVNIVL